MRFLALLFALTVTLRAQHPSLPKPGTLDGMGVNIHFTDPVPGELEMIKAAGFRWVRTDITWVSTERERGVYDFSRQERLVAALAEAGIRAYFILDYGNPLYADPGDKHPFTSRAGTPEFRAAFVRWAVAAVSHFRGKGIVWELWNEPNNENFWKPKPNAADYIALVKETAAALEAAGLRAKSRTAKTPGECFVGPAGSKFDMPFLDGCFAAGLLDVFDAVSVHPYRQAAPETTADHYRELRLLIRRHSPRSIPIISGEWGYSTVWKGHSDELQASYLPRMFLANLANDIPLSIWYDWRDDGDDASEPEHRFGIVRRRPTGDARQPFTPKPAYDAAKAFSQSPLRIPNSLRLPDDEAPILVKEIRRELRGIFSQCELTGDGDSPVQSEQRIVVEHPNVGPCPLGTPSQRLFYKLPAGPKYLRIAPKDDARKIEGKPKELGLWLHGDAQGGTPAIRLRDETGQIFQARGEPITWTGWRYLRFPMDPEADSEQTLVPMPDTGGMQRIKWGNWGGAKDGKVHGALSWDTLFLLDGNKRPIAGDIYLSAPTLVY